MHSRRAGRRQSRRNGLDHVRRETPQLVQQGLDRRNEIAAVPVEAGGQVAFGLGPVRLLHKPRDRGQAWPGRLDIAEGRRGCGRLDTEGHDAPVFRCFDRLGHDAPKSDRIRDIVVGRHEDGGGPGVETGDPERGGRHRGCGIPSFRFEDQFAFNAQGGKLCLDMLPMGPASDDDKPPVPGQGRNTSHSVLEQGLVADQIDELLGTGWPGRRPQPSPGAAAQDYREYRHCHPSFPKA